MREPEVAPDLVDAARRLAVAVAEGTAADRESMVVEFARKVLASRGGEARFATFYEKCPSGVVLVDPKGVIGAANPAFLKLARIGAEDELLGTRAEELGATARDRSALAAALEAGDRVLDRLAIRSRPDASRLVRLTATTLPGERSRYPILMFEDTHDLRQLQETIQHQSLHDPLTGLPNNAHFRSKLEGMLADRDQGRIGLVYLDIDGFKVVNDGLGTEVADKVLRGVAGTLRAVFAPAKGFVARLFGDGFAVALRGELEPSAVVKLVEQTICELAKPVYAKGVGVGVSASAGIVVAEVPGAEHDELIRSAEVSLHRAKELGKAQWVVFDPRSGRADRDRYRLAAAIAGALELGQITVVYQPHVVLPDAQIVTSLNAALLWNHPTRGRLRSEEFYALAETTGMTVPLGKHLLRRALETKASWQARFGDGAPMVCLTLPRRMAIDADLVAMVRAELDRAGLEPRHLMLCADAESLIDDRGDLIDSLGHLARLGVLFVLNITGLPELELIPAHAIPAPGVMLRGPIVDVLAADDAPAWARRNVRQLVERAEEMGVKVGAYGVVSQTQAELLYGLGVVVASGSYQPEYQTSSEAEVWVGRTFPMG
ncbi:diguanylate cyclase domain-containing protein [Amycolatopsis sp. NPDC049252]|uniref:diguanylate cyclase domain-containing protein n=1 Tax=Amycolatopsis sp. NPDC049252 TaxID=3363933 RepID=UPI0037117B1C